MVFAAIAAVTLSASPAFARGPYLPQNSLLTVPGDILYRGGLTQCDGRDPACDEHAEFVLVKAFEGYEHVNVKYNCYEIDDGPYGALKCEQIGYTQVGKYSTCVDMGSRPFAPADLIFGTWYCNK